MTSATGQLERLPLSRGQIVLRVFGAVFLTACALMAVLGFTVFAARLHGMQFVLYWSWCLVLTFAAIIAALWDMLLVRRASKKTQREMFRRQFINQRFTEELRKKCDQEQR
jgi:membrane protein implicated in regulation of membrane protease activity